MAFNKRGNNSGRDYKPNSMVDSRFNSIDDGADFDAKLSVFHFGQKVGVKIHPPLPEEQQTDYSKFDSDVEVCASGYFSTTELMTFVTNARTLIEKDSLEFVGKKKAKEVEIVNTYIDNTSGTSTMILHKKEDGINFYLEIREYSAKNPDKIIKSLMYDFDITPMNAGFNIGEDTRKGKTLLPPKVDIETFLKQLEMAATVGSQLHQTHGNIMYHVGRLIDTIEIINGKLDSLFNGRSAGVGRGNSKERSYSRSGATESRYGRKTGNTSRGRQNNVDEESADIDDLEDTMDDDE